MSGDSVIAGPEVDMVEVDPVSSLSSSSMAVDLNLNLSPPFVLELALGRDQGGFCSFSPPVSRNSWPRFEPRMLDGAQEEGEQEQDQEEEEEENSMRDHISSNFGERDSHPHDDDIRASQLPPLNLNINDDDIRASGGTNVNANIVDEDDDEDIRPSQQTGVNAYIDDDSNGIRSSGGTAVNQDNDYDVIRVASQRTVNTDINDGIRASVLTSVDMDIHGDGGTRASQWRDVNVNINDDGIEASQQRDMNLNIDAAGIRTSQETSLSIEHDASLIVRPQTVVNTNTDNDGISVVQQTDVNADTDGDGDGISNTERYQDQVDEEGSSFQTSPQTLRSPRHTRSTQQSGHALFTPIRDVVETHETSSEHASTNESSVLVIIPSSTLSAVSTGFSSIQVPRTENLSLEMDLLDRPNDEEEGKKIHGSFREASFECNICLEMAVEPVVSCCGHLFCWSCIYKWLHLHSNQKECPVCKGFLSDDVITPIYGRGTSEASDRPHGSTPPRPHAHRLDGRMRFPERSFHERLSHASNDRLLHENNERSTHERTIEIDGIARSDSSLAESSEAEASRSAETILNRLRIVQRLQREHLDERLRLRWRQRMMGRRGSAFRSFVALEAVAPQVLISSEDHIQTQYPSYDETNERNIETDRDVNEGSGLRPPYPSSSNERISSLLGTGSNSSASIENVQLHSVTQSSHSMTLENSATLLSHVVTPHPVTLHLDSIPYAVTLGSSQPMVRSSTTTESEVSMLHGTTGELQQSWRAWHDSASGSLDVEAECLHTRKRRRLN